ncbi:S41 family peptidase [Thalassotalea aquiviva]|uniref:S41 family peptidase n=1 Tax=Thalassotalea aquiviva TaxID=3242415 RepID=UPI00352BAC44
MLRLFKRLLWLVGGFVALFIVLLAVYMLRLWTTDWSEAARDDIEAWHTMIKEHHPGPVDQETPAFAQIMETARREALLLAERAENRAGYRWSMERYKAIHDDPHLHGWAIGLPDLGVEHWFGRYDWPGFYAGIEKGSDGETVMRVTAAGGGFETGDVIVSCDGRDISDWLDETIFAFRGSGIPARARAAAPWLFTKHGNPFIASPQSCRVAGTEVERKLIWASISAADWKAGAPGQRGSRRSFGFKITADTAWITIPTFNNSRADSLQELSESIQSNTDAIRSAKLVILDIRGNGGGNSAWGRLFSRNIWSSEYVEAFWRTGAQAVDWRLSQDNVEHVHGIAKENLENDLASGPAWARLAEDMEKAFSNGETLYRQTFTQRQPARNVISPVSGKVIVLMDSACGSSCLDFLDLVTSFENVLLVGEETGADTNYIDVRGVFLPGYRFRVSIPLKVYRGRIRPNGGSYLPTLTFPVDLDQEDEEAVIAWLKTALH